MNFSIGEEKRNENCEFFLCFLNFGWRDGVGGCVTGDVCNVCGSLHGVRILTWCADFYMVCGCVCAEKVEYVG